jgi:hypothetical protein
LAVRQREGWKLAVFGGTEAKGKISIMFCTAALVYLRVLEHRHVGDEIGGIVREEEGVATSE